MSSNIFAPRNEIELLQFLDHEGSRSIVISGATDLLPRIRRGQEHAAVLVDVSRVKEFRYLRKDNGLIRIGSLTTIADLSASTVLGPRYEAFRRLGVMFGSPPVRNLATVGGNVAAASSSEDLIPILLVLDASLRLKSRTSERIVPLDQFILGKRETSCMNNEFISEVSFNDMDENSWCTFEKIGRRERLIIALVSVACFLKLNPISEEIEDVRVALNRIRGRIPARAYETEQFLKGRTLSAGLLQDSAIKLEKELLLTSDFRASASYRVRVAKNFLVSALMHCRQVIKKHGAN